MRTQTKPRPAGRRPRTPSVSLEKAARANDLRSFVAATGAVDWSTCAPKDFIRAVDHALSLGAFALARDISEKGHQRWPNHPGLGRYASVLAPPRILHNDRPADPTIGKNEAWLRKHSQEFRGRWVAVKDGELLGSADVLADLVREVGKPSKALFSLID
jgi:hypothetical protein